MLSRKHSEQAVLYSNGHLQPYSQSVLRSYIQGVYTDVCWELDLMSSTMYLMIHIYFYVQNNQVMIVIKHYFL